MRERPEGPTQPQTQAGSGAARDPLLVGGGRERWWRLLGLAWMLVLIGPVTELFHTHQSRLRLGFGLAGAVTFAVLFFWMVLTVRDGRIPTFAGWWVAFTIAAVEAVALNLVYGTSWIGLFIFVSVGASRAPTRVAAWLIAANSIAACAVGIASGASITASAWFAFQVGLIGVGMIGIFRTIRINRELAAARGELAKRAVAEERLRFARDLHDSVTQELFSMTLHARTTLKSLDRAGARPDDPLRQQVQILSDLAQSALAEMRMLIFELRPGALTEEGLIGAVRKLAASVSAREGIAVDVDAPRDRLPLAHTIEEHLYRFVQEALNNVVKHAGARCAVVRVVAEGDARLVVEVRDDGKGFDPAVAHPGHMGLDTMAARASELGGDYALISAPGAGTAVRVIVPLNSVQPDGQRSTQPAHALMPR